MLERQLYENYRISVEQVSFIGEDVVINADGKSYLLRNSGHLPAKKIEEQMLMAEYLIYNGEPHIARPVLSQRESYISVIDGESAIIYDITSDLSQERFQTDQSAGRKLARFHLKGEAFEASHSVWNGTWYAWQDRWIKRLDQLENWYVKKQKDPYKTPGDEWFLLSFPYFLGVTENAIQMMNTIQTNNPFLIREGKGNTICHQRFHEGCWLTVDERHVGAVKVPTDFTYDHFTRDTTEYIRHLTAEPGSFNKKTKRIERFLHRYQTIKPFDGVDFQLLIARLAFPVHYFELVEEYYRTVDDERKAVLEEDLSLLFTGAEEYEHTIRFVASLFPDSKNIFVLPEWLSNKK